MDCYELFPSGLRVEHLPAWSGSFKFHSLTRVILGCSYGFSFQSFRNDSAWMGQLSWSPDGCPVRSTSGLCLLTPLLCFVALLVEECCPYEYPCAMLGFSGKENIMLSLRVVRGKAGSMDSFGSAFCGVLHACFAEGVATWFLGISLLCCWPAMRYKALAEDSFDRGRGGRLSEQ